MGAPAWKLHEIEYLRSHVGILSRSDLGRTLGRSPDAIGQQARKLGIARKHFVMSEASLDQLRRLVSDGWSDAEIAGVLGTNRNTAGAHRRRLGLPSQRDSARHRRRVGLKTREQCRRDNFRNFNELRRLARRVHAARAGWPPEASRRDITILEALQDGPKTGVEIARTIGLQRPPVWHLTRLEGWGFLTVDRDRPKRWGGGRRKPCRYALAIQRRKKLAFA